MERAVSQRRRDQPRPRAQRRPQRRLGDAAKHQLLAQRLRHQNQNHREQPGEGVARCLGQRHQLRQRHELAGDCQTQQVEQHRQPQVEHDQQRQGHTRPGQPQRRPVRFGPPPLKDEHRHHQPGQRPGDQQRRRPPADPRLGKANRRHHRDEAQDNRQQREAQAPGRRAFEHGDTFHQAGAFCGHGRALLSFVTDCGRLYRTARSPVAPDIRPTAVRNVQRNRLT